MRAQQHSNHAFKVMAMIAASGMAGAATYYNGSITDSTLKTSNNDNIVNDGNGYFWNWNVEVGRNGSGSSLQIFSGSVTGNMLTVSYASTGNRLLIDGANSSFVNLQAVPGNSDLCRDGTNTITVRNGGSLTYFCNVRLRNATNTTVTVDNGSIRIDPTAVGTSFKMSDNGTTGLNNLLNIKNGGLFQVGNATYDTDLVLGPNGAKGNRLRLESGGAFKLVNSASTVTIWANNYLQLNGGFLAWNGDKTGSTSINDSNVQVWDGATWTGGKKGVDWLVTYYADEPAASTAGYVGYGGYTLFRTPPPTPQGTAVIVR